MFKDTDSHTSLTQNTGVLMMLADTRQAKAVVATRARRAGHLSRRLSPIKDSHHDMRLTHRPAPNRVGRGDPRRSRPLTKTCNECDEPVQSIGLREIVRTEVITNVMRIVRSKGPRAGYGLDSACLAYRASQRASTGISGISTEMQAWRCGQQSITALDGCCRQDGDTVQPRQLNWCTGDARPQGDEHWRMASFRRGSLAAG